MTQSFRALLWVCVMAGSFMPSRGSAQRVIASPLSHHSATSPIRAAAAQGPIAASVRAPFGDSLPRAVLPLDPPRRSRGPIALRGLAWGAVIGGAFGYYLHHDEEYGGAILGPLFGAVIGAPIGMIVLLLATPV